MLRGALNKVRGGRRNASSPDGARDGGGRSKNEEGDDGDAGGERPSSSSFDNLLPSSKDDSAGDGGATSSSLMGVFDSCRQLSESASGDPRSSPSRDRDRYSKHRLPIAKQEHTFPCEDTYSYAPPSPPERWPQRPVLLRPSPASGTRVRGVRRSSSATYLPLSGTGYCSGCTLPINNGLEREGECFVIDFESELFVGTAMLRIRNVCDALVSRSSDADEGDTSSYFHNKKRTFQGVVRGRFKRPDIPMSECVTGQVFDRPAGHLPPRIVVGGAIAIISHLAPQLQARLEGDCPHFLSPLVSTAQTVIVRRTGGVKSRDAGGASIEAAMTEPQPSDEQSLIQVLIRSGNKAAAAADATDSHSVAARIKARKRAFNKLSASGSQTPAFDPSAEYTFEFFQHLILFDRGKTSAARNAQRTAAEVHGGPSSEGIG
ncbi:hypothetical protein ACHAWF_007966 [Thalassiosira exigua]